MWPTISHPFTSTHSFSTSCFHDPPLLLPSFIAVLRTPPGSTRPGWEVDCPFGLLRLGAAGFVSPETRCRFAGRPYRREPEGKGVRPPFLQWIMVHVDHGPGNPGASLILNMSQSFSIKHGASWCHVAKQVLTAVVCRHVQSQQPICLLAVLFLLSQKQGAGSDTHTACSRR